MPELPEVETTRRGLAPWFEGAKIIRIDVHQPQLRYPIPGHFSGALTGKRITRIERRSKYLILRTNDTYALIHLGMSGSMRRLDKGEKPGKHDHVVFQTDKSSVAFNDPRRFGAMDLGEGDPLKHKWLADIGPEPLGNHFNAETLATAITGKKQAIKATLLDQKVVAGIGNIYACESLWRAKINPLTPANTLRPAQLEALTNSIRSVLVDAIDSGGSTLRDHKQVDGTLGYFQHSFDVYGRGGEACHRENCKGFIETVKLSQRSTYFCPKCQK